MHITPANKYYIGITSQLCTKRWGVNGKNYNRHPYFYNAILKYGWDNIDHIILFENLSEKEAKQYEQDLIKFFNTNSSNFGYNLTYGGNGTIGIRHCGTSNGRATKVKCVTTNRVFNTILEASDCYNIGRQHIGSVCTGKRQYAGKLNGIPLIWEYYKEEKNDL